MKLREDTDRRIEIELSESNLRAMLADQEDKGFTSLTRYDQGVMIIVSVRRDEVHYSESELADRGPEWKGAVNA